MPQLVTLDQYNEPPTMNIDFLPFPAFALESCSPAALARGNGKTLTLQLALAAVHAHGEPMGGSATANEALVYCPNLLRAAVVPAEGQALTITF